MRDLVWAANPDVVVDFHEKLETVSFETEHEASLLNTSATQASALAWVKSQLGQYLDMDGVYGAQCVDLILAYYDYLGVPRSSGNGKDYATNTLPSGWQRIQGAAPQPGDILVYGASSSNEYGHVAIYESDYSTYHQNFNGHSYVEQITNIRYNGFTNPYWGVIRPDFVSDVQNFGDSFYASIYRVESPDERLTVGEAADSTAVYAAGKYSTARQRWLFTRQADGSYEIASVHNGYLLNVDNGSSDDGTLATVWMDLDNVYQRWYICTADGGYKLVSQGTGDCLNIYAASVGQNATLSTYGGYKEQILNVHVHSYAQTTVDPTCSSEGYTRYQCDCGDYYTVGNGNKGEHSWELTEQVNPSCEEQGSMTYTCAYCAESKTETIEATGHAWLESGRVEANCQQVAGIIYTCTNCGTTNTKFSDGEFSEWSETYPEDVAPELIETAVQYRYREQETITSSEPVVEGYDLVDTAWQDGTEAYMDYVPSWPAGFNTSHSLYSQYNKTPVTNSETDTQKITLVSSNEVGYIYWHWCRGSYTAGPIDRRVNDVWTSEFCAFHAFYSETHPSTLQTVAGGGHLYSNSACCVDSYWYYYTPVARLTYITQDKEYIHSRWMDWSDWSTTEYEATETRQVERREVYRYAIGGYGDHAYESVVTEPTCTEQGYTTYTCSVCGDSYVDNYVEALGHSYENGSCIVCGEADPDYSTAVKVASGWSGDLTWVLTDDGVLTFSGTGAMKNYGYKSEMPWYKYIDQITSVVINEGATRIGDYAFYGMTKLETIDIADTVTYIGDFSFKGSTALDGVVLPPNLSNLGTSSFYGCTGLTSVEIPASLYTVKPYAFKNCSSLAKVTFHEGNLMKLSDGSFYGTALTEVEFPKCLDIIDVYCFKNCFDLATITIPEGDLTQIREAVFYATAIPSITIPEGVTKVGPYAFKNCVNLKTVSLPTTLTSVGEASFYACTGLQGITIPDAVTSIGDYAFRKCAAMTEVNLGRELTDIGLCAFYGCSGLTNLEIPGKVTTIQGYAFKGCTGLTSVKLGSSVETLGESAFHTCTALKTLELPASLKTIGDYCFSGSYNLWKLTFTGNAPSIGSGAFKSMAATACYPANDSTWTSDVMQNYGGSITWKAVDENGNAVLSVSEETELVAAEPEEIEAEVTKPEATIETESAPEDTITEDTVPEQTESEVTEPEAMIETETAPEQTETEVTEPEATTETETSSEESMTEDTVSEETEAIA